MSYGEGSYSLSDIAAATGNNRNNDGAFGGDWAWIILLLLVGWGNNGFGGFGGNGAANGALTRGDLCQDMNFNDLQNAVRSGFAETNSNFRTIDNAICTLGYDSLAQASNTNTIVANGFSRLDTSLCQSFNNVAQQVNGLSSQLATCCCGIERGIDGVNYNMAMNTNQLQNAMCSNTRDVIENANNNTRAILDFLTNDKIATLQAENQNLRLAASQEAQSNFLVDKLSPKCPIPAFLTCNPYTGQTYTNGYGYGSNCGCGNY